jgi:hypothetical protein
VEPLTRGYRPQIPVLSALCPKLNLLNPLPPKKVLNPPEKKILYGTAVSSGLPVKLQLHLTLFVPVVLWIITIAVNPVKNKNKNCLFCERYRTNKMRKSMQFYCLSMFRASICPSSGEQLSHLVGSLPFTMSTMRGHMNITFVYSVLIQHRFGLIRHHQV